MHITPNEPEPLVVDYLHARQARDQAQARFTELEERLIKQMEADQRKSFRWSRDGQAHNLTYVQGHTTYIDEAGLRKALKAKLFDRYTKRVLDRRAMERGMSEGEVDPLVVSKYVTDRLKKPYLNYTQREEEK